jgi:hypothetical protein
MPFDIQGAKKAGYTDAEIAAYLGQVRNFDVQGAKSAGHSDLDIINHLEGIEAPTPQSFLQQAGQFGKQQARGLVEQLPVAGAMFGGALGVGGGLATGPAAPAVSPALGAAGTVLGAGAGQELKQLALEHIFGEQPPTMQERLTELGQEMTFALAGAGVGGILEKGAIRALAPAGKITEAQRGLVSAAQKEGLPTAPSALVPSKTARVFEWVSEKIPPGGIVKSIRARQLHGGLLRMHDEVLNKLPFKTEKFEAGIRTGEAIKGAKAKITEKAKNAYNLFQEHVSGVQFNKSAKAVQESVETLRAKGVGTGKEDLRALLEEFSRKGEKWLPDDVQRYQKSIWELSWKRFPEIGKKLWGALAEDIGPQNPVAWGLLKKGKANWKLLSELNKTPTTRAIMRKYATAPDDVIRAAFTSGNFDDLAVIRKHIDKETWDVMRSRFVENLLDASIDISGTERLFRPAKFVGLIDKYGKAIDNALPELGPTLRQFADITKASLDDIAKQNLDPFQQIMSLGGAGVLGGAAVTQNVGLAVPVTFNAMVAKSLTNPSGWLKKWLTTGVLKGAPALVREAGKVGVMKEGERRLSPIPSLRGL